MHIPIELMLDMLDIIRFVPSRTLKEQIRDLKSLALVSRSWTYPAQTVLFQDVELYGQDGGVAFLHAVTNQPVLGQLVRKLRVTVGSEDPERNCKNSLPQPQLVSILERTPFLYQIDISLIDQALGGSTFEALRQLGSCRPVALRFTNLIKDESPAIYQLVDLWSSSLKHIVVAGGRGGYANLSQPPGCPTSPTMQRPSPRPNSLSLTEFQWLGLEKPSDEIANFFLGPSSVGSLKLLKFRSLPSSKQFMYLMKAHGAFLRSLRTRDLVGVDKTALQYCVALEEFGVERWNAGDGVVDALRNYLITDSLVHLDLGNFPFPIGENAKNILDNLVRRLSIKFPSLRVVTQRIACPNATYMERTYPRNIPHGIQLDLVAQDPEFERLYLVEPAIFPQVPTIQDLRAMHARRLQFP